MAHLFLSSRFRHRGRFCLFRRFAAEHGLSRKLCLLSGFRSLRIRRPACCFLFFSLDDVDLDLYSQKHNSASNMVTSSSMQTQSLDSVVYSVCVAPLPRCEAPPSSF